LPVEEAPRVADEFFGQMQFIARQPIVNVERKVQAYELLFRESTENHFPGADPDLASQEALDTAVLLGLDVLSDGYSIFLNCPRDFLVERYPTLFPPDFTVIEVLETVEPDDDVLAALREMKRAGYRIALDDYVDQPRFAPLVELADIIKIDFRATSAETRRELAQRYGDGRCQLLAEKVETEEEFSEAAQLGFCLLQGYLLGEPEVLTTRKAPVLPDTHLRIRRALWSQRLDLIAIEQLIKSEPALCYRLLRYLKSPAFYLQAEVESILHVLALLGAEELRKWLTLMSSVVAVGGEPNPEPIANALARARFAELLAPFVAQAEPSLFLAGLFSQMEKIVHRPLRRIVDEVVLPEEVRAALSGEAGPLRQCQELVEACESGDRMRCDTLRRRFQVPETELAAMRREARIWASRATNFQLAIAEPLPLRSPVESWRAAPIFMLHRG
jgi:EAL and modified HD-GYP domain-containing signal transduction protein